MSRKIPPGRESSREPERSSRYQRIVLLGFMASGKTVVGRALARRLGWKHVDLDKQIEKHTGKLVAEIFADDGEAAFRALEAELTPRFTSGQGIVLSPGGGWVTNSDLFERLPAGTLTAWLKVSPAEVLRRLARSRRGPIRPLLSGSDDPAARALSLLAEREPLYRRAAVTIETDARSVDSIVGELAGIIDRGGPRTSRIGRS